VSGAIFGVILSFAENLKKILDLVLIRVANYVVIASDSKTVFLDQRNQFIRVPILPEEKTFADF